MSLNIRQINGNVKRKPCAPQQRKLLRTSQTKFRFLNSNNTCDLTQNNELFDKGDGGMSETTSSLEDVYDCFNLQRHKYECDAEKKLLIYDTVIEPATMDGSKQFEDLQNFLQYQTKPTPLVLKVMKSFIKMQEIGKYISRGIQAQIDINIYQSPINFLNEPLFTNYLDEVYAPLSDIHTVDVIKENERPNTSPFESKSKNCDCSTTNLKSSLNTVISITDGNLHSSRPNLESVKNSRVSRIPKLIVNKETKNKNHCMNERNEVKKSPKSIRIGNEYYESEHSKVKSTMKQECCSLVNKLKGFAKSAPSGTSPHHAQVKTPLLVKPSKIPIRGASKESCKKLSQMSGCSVNTIITTTESKTSIFQDAECVKSLSASSSIKTVVTIEPEEFQNEHNEKTDSKLNDVKNPQQSFPSIEKPKDLWIDMNPHEITKQISDNFENKLTKSSSKNVVELEQPQLLLKEHKSLWFGVNQEETITQSKQIAKTNRNNLEEKLQRIRKTIKSDTLLGKAISPILHEAIFRTKQEMEQRKDALYFIGNTPEEPLKRGSNTLANKKKSIKKEKPKEPPKIDPVPKKINKPVLKRPPEKRKNENWEIKTNIFERSRKPVQILDKTNKMFRPKVSKFSSFPRRYEDVKRNRNKEKSYVLVKSDSNRECRYLKHHEPFKIVCIDRPCNCYSHVLVSTKRQPKPTSKSGENSSDQSSITDTATLLPCTKKLDNSPLTKVIASESGCNKTQWYSITSKTDLRSDFEKEILYFNSDYTSVDESNHEKVSTTSKVSSEINPTPNVILKEWTANVQKTEKNLNELRLKIGRLATVLKEITDTRLSQVPQKNPALLKHLTRNRLPECCVNSMPKSDKKSQ
ncbi:hypothetical protein FQR65_LT03570 [Abscondita terminalis]|nr:hypothetical protein FQR65_LT03570 [Abscondita terminalis]